MQDTSLRPLAGAVLQRREQLGWSRAQLADASGLTLTFVSQLERGVALPSRSGLSRLEQALQISLPHPL